jgi:hypothetical protein
VTIFWVKTLIILGNLGQILQHIINKTIFSFVKCVATKNGLTKNFFSPLSFVAVFGSGIRDPGWVKIRIRGMNIPEPPHCNLSNMIRVVHLGSSGNGCGAYFCPSRIPDPGVKKAPDPGS